MTKTCHSNPPLAFEKQWYLVVYATGNRVGWWWKEIVTHDVRFATGRRKTRGVYVNGKRRFKLNIYPLPLLNGYIREDHTMLAVINATERVGLFHGQIPILTKLLAMTELERHVWLAGYIQEQQQKQQEKQT